MLRSRLFVYRFVWCFYFYCLERSTGVLCGVGLGFELFISLGLFFGREEEVSGRCFWGGRRRGRRFFYFIFWG